MVVRSAGLAFAASAMVFPGGKLVPSDASAGSVTALHDLDIIDTPHAVAALRESFEEAGLLLARDSHGQRPTTESIRQLDIYRKPIDRGEMSFSTLLETAGLVLALDEMVPFAHVIGPTIVPKRFDTRFYIAPAPPAQQHQVDDHEIIKAQWITVDAAFELGDSGKQLLMSPTRMVLSRLQQYRTVAETLRDARLNPPTAILPEVQTRNGEIGLYSPSAPGIAEHWEVLNTANAKARGLGAVLEAALTSGN